MKLSRPGLNFVGTDLITNLISVLVIGLHLTTLVPLSPASFGPGLYVTLLP